MRRPRCGGKVTSLRNQLVLFTGRTFVRGEHRTKDQLRAEVTRSGGSNGRDRSRDVTLLVIGEFGNRPVVDPVNTRSQKAVFAEEQRQAGNHICVVDSVGFTSLLDGESAACLESRTVGPGLIELRSTARAPTPIDDVLGAPVTDSRTPLHAPTGLDLDLSGLDRGTAAHEATARRLRDALAPVEVRGPAPGLPRFDAGWMSNDGDRLFVCEVKSLTGAKEDQQMRLGIGQLLDYAYAITQYPASEGATVVPVLALEHEPADPRWRKVTEHLGILLSWAPNFPGLRDAL